MAGKRQMSEADELALIEGYLSGEDIDVLVERHGTSRSSLYRTLDRRGIERRQGTGKAAIAAEITPALTEAMARAALRTLIDELVEARARVKELESLTTRLQNRL